MDASLTTRIKASPEGLKSVTAALERWRVAQRLEASAVWPFHVAIDEMLSNTLRCGYAGDACDHDIEVRFAIESGLMQVAIIDDARAFDPLQAPPPDISRPLEERAVGGLGIFLVRRLMDDVRYERSGGRNLLTLRRRLER